MTIVTNTYTSDTTVNIPSTAFDVTITVQSASGGIANPSPSGPGGLGRSGTFTFKTNYVARTLQIRIGQPGNRGESFGSGGPVPCPGPGGVSLVGSGACGGSSNWFSGTSNTGGGGAGATGVLLNGNPLAIAGGGGGGQRTNVIETSGGRKTTYPALAGGNATDWQANSGTFSFSDGVRQNSTIFESYNVGGGGGGSFGGSPGFRRRSPFANTASTGGGSRYDSNELNLISSSAYSGSPSVTVTYNPTPPPEITSFTANPNPQTSGLDGVPDSTTQFSWTSTNTASASINKSVGSVTTSGSITIDTGLQSVAGSNSPATKSYILTVVGLDGSTVSSAPLTVSVYNDNTPNNFSLPNQNNVEPNTSITVSSTISGIDMVTSVNGGPGVQVSTNGSSFSSNTTITNNQTLYAKVTSLGFNQDPSGLTNSKEFYVDVGTLRRYFTVTTRAPDVNETFNLPDEVDRVPYPDIDTINEPSEQFIVSNTLSIDDIELVDPNGVEIRTNNSNVQVRIKRQGASSFSGWTDVKQI